MIPKQQEKGQGQVKSYCVNQQISYRWKNATAVKNNKNNKKEENPTHCHSLEIFIKWQCFC